MITGAMLLKNVRQTARQFNTILVCLALGITLLYATAAVAGRTISQAASAADETSVLTVLQVDSVAAGGTPTPVTTHAIEWMASLDGVEEVAGISAVGFAILPPTGDDSSSSINDGLSVGFWAFPRFALAQPVVLESSTGDDTRVLQPGEILIPDYSLGVDMRELIGQEVEIEAIRATGPNTGEPTVRTVTIAGVYDSNSTLRDGEAVVYFAPAEHGELHRDVAGLQGTNGDLWFEGALVKCSSIAAAGEISQILTDAGHHVSTFSADAAVSSMMQLLSQLNGILAVILMLLGLGVGFGVSGTWAHIRRWDVGLLRSLGFSARRILNAYLSELAILGGITAASAIVAGSVISIIVSISHGGQEVAGMAIPDEVLLPGLPWVLGILLGTPAVFLIGAAPRLWKLTRLEPDVALRRPD